MNVQLITIVILRLQYKNTTENFVKEIIIRRCIKNKINILKSNSIVIVIVSCVVDLILKDGRGKEFK